MRQTKHEEDTIVAVATANGTGAIAVVRLSGGKAIEIVDSVFESVHVGKKLRDQQSHQVFLGNLVDNNRIIDQVLVSIFRNPNSYTGEDVVEISCHGSIYVQQEILHLCLAKGARMANAGEFTLRAFLHGKLDLSQAEAVADLIAAESKAEHEIAIRQMRGGFSTELKLLREQLINFTALIELELDFSEEDVEFADRTAFLKLIHDIQHILKKLIDSFAYGNVIKAGVPVAIVGKPNAGKSSLLNALLNEEKAIVSAIAGTTRDAIEDTLILDGIKFRFIDTAGIRETTDEIEAIGVQRAKEKAAEAAIVLYLFTESDNTSNEVIETTKELYRKDSTLILVENKIDEKGGYFENPFNKNIANELFSAGLTNTYLAISTLEKQSVEQIKQTLLTTVQALNQNNSSVVSNSRHKNSLEIALQSLQTVELGLNSGLSGDLLSIDIRTALSAIGEITGEVDLDTDILGTIFGKFCIGK